MSTVTGVWWNARGRELKMKVTLKIFDAWSKKTKHRHIEAGIKPTITCGRLCIIVGALRVTDWTNSDIDPGIAGISYKFFAVLLQFFLCILHRILHIRPFLSTTIPGNTIITTTHATGCMERMGPVSGLVFSSTSSVAHPGRNCRISEVSWPKLGWPSQNTVSNCKGTVGIVRSYSDLAFETLVIREWTSLEVSSRPARCGDDSL